MSERKKYDSTIARIAGNLLSGDLEAWLGTNPEHKEFTAREAVRMALAIVAECERTQAAIEQQLQEQPF